MKKLLKSFAVVLLAVMCMGALFACDNTGDPANGKYPNTKNPSTNLTSTTWAAAFKGTLKAVLSPKANMKIEAVLNLGEMNMGWGVVLDGDKAAVITTAQMGAYVETETGFMAVENGFVYEYVSDWDGVYTKEELGSATAGKGLLLTLLSQEDTLPEGFDLADIDALFAKDLFADDADGLSDYKDEIDAALAAYDLPALPTVFSLDNIIDYSFNFFELKTDKAYHLKSKYKDNINESLALVGDMLSTDSLGLGVGADAFSLDDYAMTISNGLITKIEIKMSVAGESVGMTLKITYGGQKVTLPAVAA